MRLRPSRSAHANPSGFPAAGRRHLRAAADPTVWAAIILPAVAVGEWHSAVRYGHVGPALITAGIAAAPLLALRLAMTPTWVSDLAVSAAAITVAALIHVRIGGWTGTHLASQPASVTLVLPLVLLAAAVVAGSVAAMLLRWTGWLAATRATLAPLGAGPLRTVAAVGLAGLAWLAL